MRVEALLLIAHNSTLDDADSKVHDTLWLCIQECAGPIQWSAMTAVAYFSTVSL